MEKKNNIILYINTSSSKEIFVALETASKRFELKKKTDRQKAQVVLPMIDEILRRHRLTLRDISEVKVHTGHGSFTGLRVGISVANAIAYILRIPINGRAVGEFVDAVYP